MQFGKCTLVVVYVVQMCTVLLHLLRQKIVFTSDLLFSSLDRNQLIIYNSIYFCLLCVLLPYLVKVLLPPSLRLRL